jgi:hypothetical protein
MKPGSLKVPANQSIGNTDIYVCDSCWKLLQNPVTALQLIRGQITLALRGTMPEPLLDQMLQNFMAEISKWKPVQKT